LMAADVPSLGALIPLWFLVGFGWSLVQTPAGRVLNRSSEPADRSAYFSAQFALSHACWLIAYPVAGFLGAALGIGTTSFILGLAVLAFAALSALLWPSQDQVRLEHHHKMLVHEHLHSHDKDDLHHQHDHDSLDAAKPHRHSHRHKPLQHAHDFHVDDHHPVWPSYKN